MNVKRRTARELILRALSKPKSIRQLLEITSIPERTLRYNISILRRENLVAEVSRFPDMRRRYVVLVGGGRNG